MEAETKIADIEIMMMAGFVDVLEVLEKYDNIKEVKDDIKKRKKLMKKEIKYMEKNDKVCYSKEEVEKVLKSIQLILKRNEWLNAKEYVQIMLDKIKDQ